jgi:hypothetical protein
LFILAQTARFDPSFDTLADMGIDAWSLASLAVGRYSNDAPRVERQYGDLLTLGPTLVKFSEEVPRTCTCHAKLSIS